MTARDPLGSMLAAYAREESPDDLAIARLRRRLADARADARADGDAATGRWRAGLGAFAFAAAASLLLASGVEIWSQRVGGIVDETRERAADQQAVDERRPDAGADAHVRVPAAPAELPAAPRSVAAGPTAPSPAPTPTGPRAPTQRPRAEEAAVESSLPVPTVPLEPRRPTVDRLVEEAAAIRSADAALRAGDLALADRRVAAYLDAFPTGKLRDDALALAAIVDCRRGDLDAGSKLLATLLARHAQPTFVDRVRQACRAAADERTDAASTGQAKGEGGRR